MTGIFADNAAIGSDRPLNLSERRIWPTPGEKLSRHSQASSTQTETDGEFPHPDVGPHQQQVRHVHAADQQHESHGRLQQVERRADVLDQLIPRADDFGLKLWVVGSFKIRPQGFLLTRKQLRAARPHARRQTDFPLFFWIDGGATSCAYLSHAQAHP